MGQRRRSAAGTFAALAMAASMLSGPTSAAGQEGQEKGRLLVLEGSRRIGTDSSDPEGYTVNIYTLDVRTAEWTQLTGSEPTDTSDGTRNLDPQWSPDGTQIAFASNRDGHMNIYVMNADGSDVTKLTDDPVEPPRTTPEGDSTADDWSPTWRHDGKAIAFVSARNGKRKVYLMGTDGRVWRRIKTGSLPIHGDLAWSPCGPWLALTTAPTTRNRDAWVVSTNSWRRNKVGGAPPRGRYAWGDPSWRPNCKRIALRFSDGFESHIYRVRPDGSFLKRTPLYDPNRSDPGCPGTVDCETANRDPAWSSHGAEIAYTHTYSYAEHIQVRAYNVRTGQDRLILEFEDAQTRPFYPSALHWQPN